MIYFSRREVRDLGSPGSILFSKHVVFFKSKRDLKNRLAHSSPKGRPSWRQGPSVTTEELKSIQATATSQDQPKPGEPAKDHCLVIYKAPTVCMVQGAHKDTSSLTARRTGPRQVKL